MIVGANTTARFFGVICNKFVRDSCSVNPERDIYIPDFLSLVVQHEPDGISKIRDNLGALEAA